MAMVYRYIGILTIGVVFFRSPGFFHSQDSFPSTFHPRLWETSSGVVAAGVFAAEALNGHHDGMSKNDWKHLRCGYGQGWSV